MRTAPRLTAVVLVGLALLRGAAAAQLPFCQIKLPTRAFVVEGGSIALRAFVVPNRDRKPGSEGDARYPTAFLMIVTNETAKTVWASVDWRFPGEEWKPGDNNKIESGGCAPALQDRLGVVADTPIHVRIAVFGDKKRTRPLGVQETHLLFTSAERDGFLETHAAGRNTLMTGWPEMGHPATDVPGTLADEELQTDIQLLIWKEESKRHRDCNHEAVRAERAAIDHGDTVVTGLLTQAQGARAARQLLLQQAADTTQPVLRLERWFIKSCDALTTYLVLLVPTRGRGTDVIIRKLGEGPAGGVR